VSQSHLVRSTLTVLSVASFVVVAQSGCARGAVESAELAAYGDDSVQTESNLEAIAQSFVGKSSKGTTSKLTVQALRSEPGASGIRPLDIVKNPAGNFYTVGCLSSKTSSPPRRTPRSPSPTASAPTASCSSTVS
jgi:hypothetical protein